MECTCQKDFSSSSSDINGSQIRTLTVSQTCDVSQDACLIDFGEVPVGEEASRVLKLRNDSVSSVAILPLMGKAVAGSLIGLRK